MAAERDDWTVGASTAVTTPRTRTSVLIIKLTHTHTHDDEEDDEMSARRRPGGARKMKAFSRIETMTNEGQFDRALKRKDQLILVEFVSVREVMRGCSSRVRFSIRWCRAKAVVERPRVRGRGGDRGIDWSRASSEEAQRREGICAGIEFDD